MEKDNRFMDYLFNEFLELERLIGKSQSHRFLSIISKYIQWGFRYDNPEKARQYAQMTFSSIEYAVFNWKTHLLDLKEEHGQDAKKNVKKYIKRLRYKSAHRKV